MVTYPIPVYHYSILINPPLPYSIPFYPTLCNSILFYFIQCVEKSTICCKPVARSTWPKNPTKMLDRSISFKHIFMVDAFADRSEVMPQRRSTGTNVYPWLPHNDWSWGQYFFVSSSRSNSRPPNGELKNTRMTFCDSLLWVWLACSKAVVKS